MLRPALALVAALALLALPTPASAEPDPMAGAPSVGDCFDITYQQGAGTSLREDPVACRRQHTLSTFVVGELPASVDWNSSDERILRAVVDVCAPARDKILGPDQATQYLSLYTYFWFMPTEAQKENGARWFSCHLTLSTGARLLPLPEKPSRLSKKDMADSVARCGTRKPAYTACSEPHVARAVHATVVDKKATERNARSAAARICPRHVSKRYSGYTYRTVSPRSFALACYSLTRR